MLSGNTQSSGNTAIELAIESDRKCTFIKRARGGKKTTKTKNVVKGIPVDKQRHLQ